MNRGPRIIAAWIGTAVVAVSAAVISIQLTSRPPAMPAGDQPLESIQGGFPVDWLYTTTNEMVIGGAGGRQLRLPVAVVSDGVVWTNDGTQAIALTSEVADRPGSLIVLHAATGRVDRYACEDCHGIFVRGPNSVVTTSTSTGATFRFKSWTFAANAAVEDLETQVPTTDNRPLLGGWTNLLVSYDEEHERFKLGLYTFDGEHEIEYRMDTSPGQVAAVTTADSTVVATSPDPDLPGWYCEKQPDAIVQLLTPDGARVFVPEPASLAGIDTADLTVRDIWWERSSFRASFGSISCRATESPGESGTTSAATYSIGTIGNFTLDTATLTWTPDPSPKGTSPRLIERAGSTHGGGEYSHIRECGIFGAADPMHCATGSLTLAYGSGAESVAEDVVAFFPRPGAAEVSLIAQAIATRTQCEVVSPTGNKEQIADIVGEITCTEAKKIYLDYRASPPATGGNINAISNDRWRCSMPTAGTFAATGRVASCESPTRGQWSFRVQASK